MGVTRDVAEFVASKGYAEFSREEVEAAKRLILDCVGGMIGGARERASQIAIQYVRECGDAEQCGVFGAGLKASLTNAAMVNGTSAHAQELESIGLYTGSNPMTVIPVALSVAERFKLSGKSVIEGAIIGLEVQTRLGRGGPGSFDKGFSSIPLYGSFGAAAVTGKMLGLRVDQIQHAFGIGIAQCSGQQRQQGTMTHLLEAGLACRNGVTAALLASHGMTSDPDLIEGDWGFYDLFCSAGQGHKAETVVPSLGKPYLVTQVYMKKYGCCFWNHRAIDALVGLVREHRIRYADVERVQVDMPAWIARQLRFPDPANGESAKFSIRQALAAVIRDDGKIPLPLVYPFSDAGARDPRYVEARQKVDVVERADWTGGRSAPWSLPVTVTLKNGQQYARTVGADEIKGGPGNPLSEAEIRARYGNVTEAFLSPEQIKRSVELLSTLEDVDDVLELATLATFGKR